MEALIKSKQEKAEYKLQKLAFLKEKRKQENIDKILKQRNRNAVDRLAEERRRNDLLQDFVRRKCNAEDFQ